MIDQEFMSGDPRSLCTFWFLAAVPSLLSLTVRMPKAPRAPTSRRTPLEVQLSEDTHVGSVRRKASKAPSSAVEGHEEASDTYLSSKISRKVLDEARAQQEDDDDSDGEAARAADGLKKRVKFRPQQKAGKGKGVPATVQLRADEDEESDEEAVDFGADDGKK